MSKLKNEAEALEMGWDAADGWFVVDDGDEPLPRAKADRPDPMPTMPGGRAAPPPPTDSPALDDLDQYNGAGPPNPDDAVARSVYVDAMSEPAASPMSATPPPGPGEGSAEPAAEPPTDVMDTSLLELSSVYFDANDGDNGGDGLGDASSGPAATVALGDAPPGADRKEKVMAEIALLKKIMADNNRPNNSHA